MAEGSQGPSVALQTLAAGEQRRRHQRYLWLAAYLAINLALARYVFSLYEDILRDIEKPTDFHQYYQAAVEIQRQGSLAPLYRQYSAMALGPALPEVPLYPYPPFLAVALLPFARLDYPSARWLWLALNLVLLAGSLWIIARAFGVRIARPLVLPLALLAVLFSPTYSSLQLGQISVVLLFLLVLAFHLERRGWPAWAGVALGLTALIKLFPGFLLVYYLVHLRWRVLAGAAATLLGGFLLTLAVAGADSYAAYLRHVMPYQDVWYPGLFNVSLTGLFYRLLTANQFTHPGVDLPGLARVLAAVSSAAVLAWCAWIWWRRPRAEEGLAYGLGVLAMMLATPIDGYYNLIFAFPVLAAVAAWLQRSRPLPRGSYRLTLLSAAMVALPTEVSPGPGAGDLYRQMVSTQLAIRSGWLVAFFPPSFYGLLLLLAVVSWALWRDPAPQ